MPLRLSLLPLLALVAVGCTTRSSDANRNAPLSFTDHVDLKRLYDEDQNARATFQVGSRITPDQVAAFRAADSLRRILVDSILAAGEATTAGDYYHAAMILQHGDDSTAYRRAHELAQQAVALDSAHADARWLTAASWDRYLMSRGEPQWYGTQFTFVEAERRYGLYTIDTTRVTDEDRRRAGVRTLQQARAYAEELTRRFEMAQVESEPE